MSRNEIVIGPLFTTANGTTDNGSYDQVYAAYELAKARLWEAFYAENRRAALRRCATGEP